MNVDRSLISGVVDNNRILDGEMEIALLNLDVNQTDKIFEIGCGNPINKCLTYALQRMNIEAWSCDPVSCDASSYLNHYQTKSFQDAELPENYFDKVIDVSAIHHVHHPQILNSNIDSDIDIARKAYKILKLNGNFELSLNEISNNYSFNLYGTRKYNYQTLKDRLADSVGFKIDNAYGYAIVETPNGHNIISTDWNDSRLEYGYFILRKA
jgi:hypothetical protein